MELVDYAHLAAPFDGDAPAGENLEYDSVFMELEKALAPSAPGMIADTPDADADSVNWRDLREQSEGLADTTRDLRVVMRMARLSLLDVSEDAGLPRFAGALGLAASLLEEMWAHVHPQLDADDDMDAMMRLNSLGDLEDARLMNALLDVTVARAGRASATLRDMEVAVGKRDPREDDDTTEIAGRVSAIFDNRDALWEASGAARAGADALSRMETAWTSSMGQLAQTREAEGLRFETLPAPQTETLARRLSDIVRLITDRLPELEAAGDSPQDGDAGAQAVQVSGAINSRADADRQISKIIGWFRENEPSSPVPALLERARSMISKSFLEIIDELGEGGINEARRASGAPGGEGEA